MFHDKACIEVMPSVYRLPPAQYSEHFASLSQRYASSPVLTTLIYLHDTSSTVRVPHLLNTHRSAVSPHH